jgi:glycosyltransferase involved in cell wall biosynthesis
MSAGPLAIWLPAVRAGSGSDVFVERLASGLERAGHRAVVTWFGHSEELWPRRIRRTTPPPGVDLVHANSWTAHAVDSRGLPLVVTEHHYIGDPAFRSSRSRPQAAYHELFVLPRIRRGLARAAAVTSVTAFTARALAEHAGVEAEVIHNWVDLTTFIPATPKVEASRNAQVKLLFVGNATRRKGGDLLPRLAHELGPHFDIRCTGGLRDDQAARVSGAGVIPLGRLSTTDLIAEYQRCDAVLLPSRYEGFSYAALEAMACGKPVVGFASGAVAEVTDPDRTALLVPVDDLGALVSACRVLARQPELRLQLGMAGRDRAELMFGEARAIDHYVQVYRRTLDRHCDAARVDPGAPP